MSSGENSPHDDSLDAHVEVTFSWHALYHRVKLLLLGQSDTLPRTASLVQVLGNMTVHLSMVFKREKFKCFAVVLAETEDIYVSVVLL